MELFINITLYSGIIPLIILLLKKIAFNFKEPIVPFIWITAIASIYEIVGTGFLQINTSYWFQIYSFLEIIGLYYFFSKLFKGKYKVTINLLLFVLLIIYGISFMLWNDNGSLQAHSINSSSLTFAVVLGCVFWFKNLFKDITEEHLWNTPSFYFIAAVLMYYCSTLLLFSLGNMVFSDTYLYDYWLINVIATLILRILLTISTWKMKFK